MNDFEQMTQVSIQHAEISLGIISDVIWLGYKRFPRHQHFCCCCVLVYAPSVVACVPVYAASFFPPCSGICDQFVFGWNCLRFANPAEALGQAFGGSEAGRLGSSEDPICWSWKVLGCF